MTTNLLKSRGGFGTPEPVFRWHRCTLVRPVGGPVTIVLRMSRSLELMTDGTLRLHLMVHVGPDGVMATMYSWHRPAASAMVGTVEAERMLDEGIRELVDSLQQGIDIFVEQMPDAHLAT